MFAVVLAFAFSKSLAESWGEICGGAGFGCAGSTVSTGAGRGRGATGRLAGTVGGSGRGDSGAGSAVASAGGGVTGAGAGAGSSGGGVLTEAGAARTIRLLAHPPSPIATMHNNPSSTDFRITFSALPLRLHCASGLALAPSRAPAAA